MDWQFWIDVQFWIDLAAVIAVVVLAVGPLLFLWLKDQPVTVHSKSPRPRPAERTVVLAEDEARPSLRAVLPTGNAPDSGLPHGVGIGAQRLGGRDSQGAASATEGGDLLDAADLDSPGTEGRRGRRRRKSVRIASEKNVPVVDDVSLDSPGKKGRRGKRRQKLDAQQT